MHHKNLMTHKNDLLDPAVFGEDLSQSFGFLVAVTRTGKTLLRPIGGNWACGIRDAVQEINDLFPGAKYKFFAENWSPKHFDGIIQREQIL